MLHFTQTTRKILSFLSEEGLRTISLPCDNSSGNLEAANLPKLEREVRIFFVGSGEQNFGLLSWCNLCEPQGFPNCAARHPLPAELRVCACKELLSAHCLSPPHLPLFHSNPPTEGEVAAQAGSSGDVLGFSDFRSCYSDSGSCLSSFSIPGSQTERKS